MSEQIRVVVADDHPLFREGVVTSLHSMEDINVVGQAENADEAVRVVREELPDLALLDVTTPSRKSGWSSATTTRICSLMPQTDRSAATRP